MLSIEKNNLLTAILILFSVSAFCYRYWEVFFKRYDIQGTVYYGWTLQLLAFFHILIGILSVCEYVAVVKSYSWVIGLIAFIVFLFGHSLRLWAIKSLGPWYSTQIEIKPNQPLIRTGAYSYLRNPYYLGVILEVGATPFIFNGYRTFLLSLITYFPILIMRILKEEEILKNHFDALFLDYQKKVSRLVPTFISKQNK